MTSDPADGESGLRPDRTAITLRFDGVVAPVDVRVAWQRGEALASGEIVVPEQLAIDVHQGADPQSLEIGFVAALLPNCAYTLTVDDADTMAGPAIAGAFLSLSTGIVPPTGPVEAVVGTVQDQHGVSMAGVKVKDLDTGEIVRTDADGTFRLRHVPTGTRRIEFNAHPLPELRRFATLGFPLLVQPGLPGAFPRPIHLPELDLTNEVAVDPQGVTIVTSPRIPGFKLTVQPGAARFMDQSVPKKLSVTEASVQNPPMGMPPGRVFERLFTIQPPGVTFDPPAEVEYPAPTALPIGTVVELSHYDKGAMRWVSYGRGRVEAGPDGTVIRSLPGEGVVKSAWQAPAMETEYTELRALVQGSCGDAARSAAVSAALNRFAAARTEAAGVAMQNVRLQGNIAYAGLAVSAVALGLAVSSAIVAPVVGVAVLAPILVEGGGFAFSLIDVGRSSEREAQACIDSAIVSGSAQFLLERSEELATRGYQCSEVVSIARAIDQIHSANQRLEGAKATSFELGVAGYSTFVSALTLLPKPGRFKDRLSGVQTALGGLQLYLDGRSVTAAATEDEARDLIVTLQNEAAGAMALVEEWRELLARLDPVPDLLTSAQELAEASTLLESALRTNLPPQLAVALGVTELGVVSVFGDAPGSQIQIGGRAGVAGADGTVRVLAVPAGISVGGGMVTTFQLAPTVVSSALVPAGSDSDGDGMPDAFEAAHRLDVAVDDASLDPDGDGLSNVEEYLFYGDPNDPDTDHDGVSDGDAVRAGIDADEQGGHPDTPSLVALSPAVGVANGQVTIRGDGFVRAGDTVEVRLGTSPLATVGSITDNRITVRLPANFAPGDVLVLRTGPQGVRASNTLYLDIDADADGLGTQIELVLGTNPNLADTDSDGLDDGAEQTSRTNPLDFDSDDDGLSDGFEAVSSSTDPLLADSDGDGVSDGQEDPDADGIPSIWEQQLGKNPLLPDARDLDGDGLDDAVELVNGGDPTRWDTDEDGLSDLREFQDRQQFANGVRLDENDTDGDGLSDGTEWFGPGGAVSAREWSENDAVLVAAGQTRIFTGRNTMTSLAIEAGGRLTTVGATIRHFNRIEVHADTVDVAVGGRIDARGLGYLGGYAASGDPADPNGGNQGSIAGRTCGNSTTGVFSIGNAGGSHGGGGWGFEITGPQRTGHVYGEIDRPTLPGGGGNWGTWPGANGGGVVRLVAQHVHIDGEVDGSGLDCFIASSEGALRASGAGAGGSVWITAQSITGAGAVRAHGGGLSGLIGFTPWGASGGGGGRIALEVTAGLADTLVTDVAGGTGFFDFRSSIGTPPGSAAGAAGTVFLRTPAEPDGVLAVDETVALIVSGTLGALERRTELPGLPLTEVVSTGGRMLQLATDDLVPGHLVGLEVATPTGQLLGVVIGNTASAIEVDFTGAPPIAGSWIQSIHRFGSLRGKVGARVDWAGCLLLSGVATPMVAHGSWRGEHCEVAQSVHRFELTGGTFEAARLTQSGQPLFAVEELRVGSGELRLPSLGMLQANLVSLTDSTLLLGAKVVADLVELKDGSTWLAAPSRSGTYVPIDIQAAAIVVQGPHSGFPPSRIDASAAGYVGGSGSGATQAGETWPGAHLGGATQATNAHSGSHGGRGNGVAIAPSSAASPAVFDRIDWPQFPGAGGGMNSYQFGLFRGGNGGGVVLLHAQACVVDGEIRADGEHGVERIRTFPSGCGGVGSSGAGAGGTIRITGGALEGTGVLSVVGGRIVRDVWPTCESVVCTPGAGGYQFGAGRGAGGGRIAVWSDDAAFSGTMRAEGGASTEAVGGAPCAPMGGNQSGGAGTIWRRAGGVFGHLRVDNGNTATTFVSTPLAATPIVAGFGVVDATGQRFTTSTPFATGSAFGHVGRHLVVDGDLLRPLQVLAHGTDWVEVDGSLPVGATISYAGAFVFDSLTVAGNASVHTLGEVLVLGTGAPLLLGGGTIQ